jgi:hypothetical protein
VVKQKLNKKNFIHDEMFLFSQADTNAAHIIEVSLKMAYSVRPEHVGEVTNKKTI